MRAVVQRVEKASVSVDGSVIGSVGAGLVVFLGVGQEDGSADSSYLAEKIAGLRIFADEDGMMNRPVKDSGGAVLCISQFTLFGDCRKGRRPSFAAAAPPAEAERLYEEFCDKLRGHGIKVETGRFQAMMRIKVINDGPVTILLDSKKLF